jgi:alkaline phosphatase D
VKVSRRLVLGGLAAMSCGRAMQEPGPASPDFPQGVCAGDPDSRGALLWTRYTGTGALRLELWPRGDPATRLVFPVTPTDEGIALVRVEDLAAGTWWHYAFVGSKADGEVSRSEEGRFRTALAADALAPLRIGASSCADQEYPLTPFSRVADELECDVFLMLGDNLYADGAKTLDEYRQKWREALARRPTQRLRASTGLISTWDDHEIVNNATGELDPAQIQAARTATFEYQPWRESGASPGRLWRSIRWGRTVEFFVLDCRSERAPSTGQYMSREQLDWLKAGLAASPARFKLVLNSVPISNYPGAFFALTLDDRWQGYPAERTELLEFIEGRNIPGVLWLTGDFHMGVAGRVSATGPGSTMREIAAGPAGQFANPSPSYPAPPQFDFATAEHNVAVLDLDPAAGTVRVRFLDGGTRTLFDTTWEL